MIIRITLIFVKKWTRNAVLKSNQDFQSGKFSVLMSITAAAPMSPATVGLSPSIIPLYMVLSLNFFKAKHIPSTIRKEGRTTAAVAVNEPRTQRNWEAPLLLSTV